MSFKMESGEGLYREKSYRLSHSCSEGVKSLTLKATLIEKGDKDKTSAPSTASKAYLDE